LKRRSQGLESIGVTRPVQFVRLLRITAATAGAGAGAAATAVLAGVPPGLAAGQPARLVAEVLGRRPFWAAWVLSVAVIVLLLVVARGWRRAGGRDLGAVVTVALAEPLLWGCSLPLLALALDPWFFHRTAPVLAACGVALGVLGVSRRAAALPRATRAAVSPLAVILALSVAVPAFLVLPGPPWFHPVSGDEPHYLVIARSLWVDGDLDVANEYGQRLLTPFWPDELPPHAKPGADPERRYSIHGTGLAVWLAPWYGLGRGLSEEAFNVLIRTAMSLWLAAAAAALFVLLRDIAGAEGSRRNDTRIRSVATRGTALAAFTLPLLFAGPHLFPEVPAFALSCAAWAILRRRPGVAGALAAGLLLAALPWLHFKFFGLMAAVAAVGVAAMWRQPADRRVRPLAALLTPMAATIAGHLAFTWKLYGRLSPLAIHVGVDTSLRATAAGDDWLAYLADPLGALVTAAGYFMDQREGLLFYAPHYLLAAAGFAWLWRRRRADACALGLAFAALVVPYALSQEIGHWAPPARPLTAVLWTLAVPMGIGVALPAGPGGRRRAALRGALVGWGIGVTVLLLLQADLLYHDYGVSRSLVLLRYGAPGLPLAEIAPLWIGPDGVHWLVSLVWLAVAIAIGIDFWRWGTAAAAAGYEPSERPAPGGGTEPGTAAPAGRAAAAGNRDPGPVAAVATILAAAAFLLWHHARVPLSELHEPWSYDRVRYWKPLSPPTRAWAGEGGIWTGGNDTVDLLISSPAPLGELVFALTTMAPMRVDVQVGRDRRSAQVVPEARSFARFAPGPARRWRGEHFYHLQVVAHGGVSPAALGQSDDGSGLGVFLAIVQARAAGR